MSDKHEEILNKCRSQLDEIDKEIKQLEGVEGDLARELLKRWKSLRNEVTESVNNLERLIKIQKQKQKQNGQGI